MYREWTSLSKPSCGRSEFDGTSGPAHQRHNESGLTLIDVTIVLIIISLLLFPALKLMDINKQNLENTRLYGVTNDLALIVNDYALRNGAYPIPADPSLPVSDPNVFKSVPASYLLTLNCSNNTDPGMTYAGVKSPNGVLCRRQEAGNGNTATQVYVGALPVSTLGLPVEACFDQYGNKFTYIVTRILTPSAAPRPIDDLANNTKGAIIVQDQNGVALTTASTTRLAHFAIITHGSNGAGAFKANGTIDSHTCLDPSTANLDERNRWACRTGGKHTAGIVTDNIITSSIQKKSSVNLGGNAATYFDDAIAYKTTAFGKIWTPRQANEEYFTLGRRVGVGFTNADASPTEMLTIKGGNLKASGDAAIPKVCNDNNTNCFAPSDIGSANGPINCSQKAPLKKVNQITKTNASGECDDVKINTVMSTDCEITGIRTLTSLSGVPTCM